MPSSTNPCLVPGSLHQGRRLQWQRKQVRKTLVKRIMWVPLDVHLYHWICPCQTKWIYKRLRICKRTSSGGLQRARTQQVIKEVQALETLQLINAKDLQEPVQHRSSTTHLGSAHRIAERDHAFFSTLAVTGCPNPQTIVRDVQLLQSTLEGGLNEDGG